MNFKAFDTKFTSTYANLPLSIYAISGRLDETDNLRYTFLASALNLCIYTSFMIIASILVGVNVRSILCYAALDISKKLLTCVFMNSPQSHAISSILKESLSAISSSFCFRHSRLPMRELRGFRTSWIMPAMKVY